MHRLVSPFILEKYAADETSGDLNAVSLFVDISGFSQITYALMAQGQYGAELLADIMRAVFDPLVLAVYAQGGFITVFAGDAFMALFVVDESAEEGWQQAARRALAAGWHILETVTQNATYDTGHGRFEVGVKVGIALGKSHWQIIETKERATFYFRGTAVDRAADAEKDANKNWLVVTPEIVALLEDQITTVVAGDHQRVLTVADNLPAEHAVTLPDIDPRVMHRFFPPKVSEATQSGEFRQVINLFISLQGPLHDEQVIQFGQLLLTLQDTYGGLLNRIDFGDKGCNALLFWGAPIAHENDASRALNFMLALQAQSPLPLRAGITQRIAHAGVIGSALQGEFTCYGNGVNLAARLMMKAPWGEIWLDETLAAKGQRTFEINQVGAKAFKGFAEPQMVHLLQRQKQMAARLYAHEMVGRETEKAQVRAFIARILVPDADKRFAGILTVMGEAGLGKSRLVHTVQMALASREDVQFALCQTDQIQRSAFNPFTYWLRSYFGQATTQSTMRNKQAFDRKLDQLLTVTTEDSLTKTLTQGRAALGSLVDLRWDNSAYEQLPPQGRYEWRLSTLKALILAESRQKPLVLVLEDIHWLDVESVAFVERLCRAIDAYPLALVATSRPTVANKPLLGQAHYEVLDLTMMAETDMGHLLRTVLTGSLAEDVTRLIVGRAQGNPFFGEQIGLYLRAKGVIVQANGVWRLVATPEGRYLPQDIRTVFTARLDQLTIELKGVVQTAAILGREFEVQVLSDMLQEEATLTTKIEAIESETIWATLSQVRYLFKHALLRDAAYAMQVRARRSRLHHLAAEAMITLYAAELPPHYEAIAGHYMTAYKQGLTKVRSKAVHYARLVAEQARGAYEHQRVVAYVGQALAILTAEEVTTSYALLLWREEAYHLLGERDQQRADLAKLTALAVAESQWQVAILLRQIKLADATGAYEDGIGYASQALAIAQTLGDTGQEAAVEALWGSIKWHQGEYEASKTHLERGLTLAEASGRRDVLAQGLIDLGIVVMYQGEYEAAGAYYEQSLAISQESGDRQGEGSSLNNLGNVARSQGEYKTAGTYYEQSLVIKREIGDRQGEASSLNNLGLLAMYQGEYRAAKVYHEQSLTIKREVGDRQGEGVSLNNLGMVALVQGAYGVAGVYHEQSLAIKREIGDRQGEGGSLGNLGLVAMYQGAYEVARAYHEQSLTISREIGGRWGEGADLNNLGYVALAQGLYTEAQAYHAQSLAIWEALAMQQYIGLSLTALADVLIYRAELNEAKALLERAVTIRRALNEAPYLMESLAILARYYLATSDQTAALDIASEIDAFLTAGGDLGSTEYGWRTAWLCYQSLRANGDERATARLTATYEKIMTQAAKIKEADVRADFLQKVPWHQQIVAAYSALNQHP